MKGLIGVSLVVVACMLVYCEANNGGNHRGHNDGRNRRGYHGDNGGRNRGGHHGGNGGRNGGGHPRNNGGRNGNRGAQRNPYSGGQGGCGGKRQACCQTAQPCQAGLECKLMGDRSWFSATGKCVRPRKNRQCGGEGMDCCRRRGSQVCRHGLECAANMCRNPSTAVNLGPPEGTVGQTTVTASGWLLVRVRARGGKCFVKIRGNLSTSVESYGEGTFGEVFGNLTGMGECEEGASGSAIGYIRAEVMSTATLTEDGDCISDGTTNITAETQVRGQGISIGIGGEAGSNVGCNKGRRLRVLGYIPL